MYSMSPSCSAAYSCRTEDSNSESDNKSVSFIESRDISSSCSCKIQHQNDVIKEVESVENLSGNKSSNSGYCVSESNNRCRETSQENTMQDKRCGREIKSKNSLEGQKDLTIAATGNEIGRIMESVR